MLNLRHFREENVIEKITFSSLNITFTIWEMKGGHDLWKNGTSKAQNVVLLLGNYCALFWSE